MADAPTYHCAFCEWSGPNPRVQATYLARGTHFEAVKHYYCPACGMDVVKLTGAEASADAATPAEDRTPSGPEAHYQ